MASQNQIEGGWTELKGKLKEAWDQLGDDELREFQGDFDQLVGWIQRKTGDTQQEVQRCLAELDDRFRPLLEQFAETARGYYDQTMNATGETVHRMREEVAAHQEHTKELVRRHPMESVAVAFGTGLIVGVVVGLIVRSK